MKTALTTQFPSTYVIGQREDGNRGSRGALLRRWFLMVGAAVGALAFTLLMGWPWFVYIPIFLVASWVLDRVFP